MANIVEIITRLKDEASGGLEKLGQNLRKIADVGLEPIARISPTAASALGGLLDKAGPTGIAVAAIGGAAVATVGGLFSLVKSAANTADNLRDLSTRTGASVEALQALGHAASKSGGSLEEVAGSFRFLQRAIAEATEDNKQSVQVFERLRVSLTELRGLSPEQQFETLARAIMQIPDPAERAKTAMEVFGRAGVSLLPTLKEVAETGLQGVITAAQRLGITISTETAAQADAFNDKLQDLSAVGAGVAQMIGSALLPAFLPLIEALLEGIVAVGTFLRETGLLTVAVKALEVALFPVIEAFKTLGAIGSAVGKVLEGDFSGAFTELSNQMKEFGEDFGKTFLGMGEKTKPVVAAIQSVGQANAQAAQEAQKLGEKQIAVLEAIGTAARTAAQNRLVAEAEASGGILAKIEAESKVRLADIERDKQARLTAIEGMTLTWIQKAEQRALAEKTAQDQIADNEIRRLNERKAAYAGFVSGALAFMQTLGQGMGKELQQKINDIQGALAKLGQEMGRTGITAHDLDTEFGNIRKKLELERDLERATGALRNLGGGFDDLVKKMGLLQALPETEKFFKNLEGLFKKGALSVGEVGSAVDLAITSLKNMGATGEQIAKILPDSLWKVKDASEKTGKAVGELGTAYGQTQEAANRLIEIQSGHSLTTSLAAVGTAAVTAAGQVSRFTTTLSTTSTSVGTFEGVLKTLEGSLARVRGAMGAANSLFARAHQYVVDLMVQVTQLAYKLTGGSLDDSFDAVSDSIERMLAGAEAGQEMLRAMGSNAEIMSIKALKAAAAWEKLHGAMGFAAGKGGGGGGGQPRYPYYDFGQGWIWGQKGGLVPGSPGQPVPIMAHAGELVVPEPITRALVRRSPSAGGARTLGRRSYQQGGVVQAAPGGITVNINLNGTMILDTNRRMDEFAKEIHHRMKDGIRRHLYE